MKRSNISKGQRREKPRTMMRFAPKRVVRAPTKGPKREGRERSRKRSAVWRGL